MPASLHPPRRTDAAPLVPSSARTRRRRESGAADPSRVAGLWEAIRRTRAELAEREARAARVVHLFDTRIRPRERAFTSAVCRLTARLVAHHERTPLVTGERALLGLWIDEHLQGLATHPFAPREETDALARRWRGLLDTGRHPSDVPLAQLHARRGHDDGARADAAGADAADGGRRRPRAGTSGDVHGAADERADGARRRGDGSAGDARARRDGTAETRPAGERHGTPEDDPARVVARLFRRLARALHPDLEPDEIRRREKHRLMSECLRARDERDIDTLLSLHEAHVGALPDDLAEGDPIVLVGLLRRQLDELRARLRRVVGGDALQRMILARYDADDPTETERRVAAHAGALEAETVRVTRLEEDVNDADGLRDALLARRELALDRLAIDELTGLVEPV